MPITVQHQPNIAQIGQVAYRTGQMQYADRRRQEEEARLLKERQMAMQQQQFGQKMAFDVWNRQFGQAGAMQQLMVQNQMQGQRDQRQQQFQMDRIGVGHQNNLALDEIQNNQQLERDTQINLWKEGAASTLLKSRRDLADYAATNAAEQRDEQRRYATDQSALSAEMKIQSDYHNRQTSGFNGEAVSAYDAEIATQSKLKRSLRGGEMNQQDYDAAVANSVQVQQDLVEDPGSRRPLQGEIGFKIQDPVNLEYTRITTAPGEQERWDFNVFDDPKYQGLPYGEAMKQYDTDHTRYRSRMDQDTGEEIPVEIWLPDYKGPNSGEWKPIQQQQSPRITRLNSQADLYDRRIKNNGDQRKALFVEREMLEDESGEIPEGNAVHAAVIDERIGRNREEADTLRAGASNIFAELGGSDAAPQAPPDLPPGMRPDPNQPDLLPAPDPGGVIPTRNSPIEGTAEGLLGGMNPEVPADMGQALASGGEVTPPPTPESKITRDATGRETNRGTEANPIIIRGFKAAMGLPPGTWAWRPIIRDGTTIGWKRWKRGNFSPRVDPQAQGGN